MSDCCNEDKKPKIDYLLTGSTLLILPAYLLHLIAPEQSLLPLNSINSYAASVFELLNRMWWGLALGILFVGILDKIPRDFIMSALGNNKGVGGIIRATCAGLLLDLCSHGILLVGMKFYERGVSLGQTMAFLIASPWNSFSLTLILFALIGLKWTLLFIALSFLIAIISGLIFNKLVEKGILPENPNNEEGAKDFKFFPEAKKQLKQTKFSPTLFVDFFKNGLKGSRMILRWILFGVVMASLIRAFVPADSFETLFGASLSGLALTLVAATIIEVCSEGSTPIAADILTRASAPGNSFAFLMTGVSTDYTEIMSLKETTKSWKIALFLPLVTLPQVITLGIILNQFA